MSADSAASPSSPSTRALLALFVTELLMLVGAFAGGLGLLIALTFLGLPAGEGAPAWSPIIQGPLLMAGAGLSYWLMQQIGFGETTPRSIRESMAGEDSREARLRRWWPNPLRRGEDRAPIGKTLGIVALMVSLAILGSMAISLVQKALFKVSVEEQDTILTIVEEGAIASQVLLGITAVILAPLTEEFLFRGMMFRRLLGGVGSKTPWVLAAYVVPAVLFAGAHWNPVGFVVYVWLALCFTTSYRLSGRLWAGVLTHAGANAITLSLLLSGA